MEANMIRYRERNEFVASRRDDKLLRQLVILSARLTHSFRCTVVTMTNFILRN
jgi:hypothetical protein